MEFGAGINRLCPACQSLLHLQENEKPIRCNLARVTYQPRSKPLFAAAEILDPLELNNARANVQY